MGTGFIVGVLGVLILSHAAYSTVQYRTLLKITEEEFSGPPINPFTKRIKGGWGHGDPLLIFFAGCFCVGIFIEILGNGAKGLGGSPVTCRVDSMYVGRTDCAREVPLCTSPF